MREKVEQEKGTAAISSPGPFKGTKFEGLIKNPSEEALKPEEQVRYTESQRTMIEERTKLAESRVDEKLAFANDV